jgi:hypothetical protein
MSTKDVARATALALALVLAAPGPAGAMTGNQRNACGALLCLLGGMMSGDCAAYLNPFWALSPPDLGLKRLDFLRGCPMGGGAPAGLVEIVAADGQRCQSASLTARLNTEMRLCEARAEARGWSAWRTWDNCRPDDNAPAQACGRWYASGYAQTRPPVLRATGCRYYVRGVGQDCRWRWEAR